MFFIVQKENIGDGKCPAGFSVYSTSLMNGKNGTILFILLCIYREFLLVLVAHLDSRDTLLPEVAVHLATL